jgi:flagellar basal-body rod protein FlgB
MSGFFENLTNRGATPALVATMSFTHARHRLIADNVANIQTPGYKARHLDYDAFQQALGKALEARGSDPARSLHIDDGDQFRTDEAGKLTFSPRTRPGRNAVFHDGTNISVEREMSDLAANAMLHEMTTTLLKGRYDGLRKAIRGQV